MTDLPKGPTSEELHARVTAHTAYVALGNDRTLTEEEEPRTNKPGGLAVPAYGPSSSVSAWYARCRCGRTWTAPTYERADELMSDCHIEGTIVGPIGR